MHLRLLLLLLIFLPGPLLFGQDKSDFIRVKGTQFMRNGQPYYFLGANYWYGMNLASTASGGDRERLKRELDQLQALGITNLRVMAATEGPDTEPNRVRPSLQPAPGIYDVELLEGLDFLLAEMAKRNMTAVLVMTNFWEWTGGMGQYISWVDGVKIPYAPPAGDGDWDSFQKFSSSFFSHKKANRLYRKHLKFMINRENTVNGLKYKEDPTIMAWQLGNEPRGYTNIEAYRKWVHKTAGYIKRQDKNHLLSIGSEGNTGSHHAGNNFYEDHLSPRIDYATMHIWIQNWAWFDPENWEETLPGAMEKAEAYLLDHIAAAQRLNKPMVLEEFGVARDSEAFAPGSPVQARDAFYTLMFETLYQQAKEGKPVAGCNFWTYAGEGRSMVAEGGNYWKEGDELMGDPPHEKQGWYSVFDTDSSTIAIIREYARLMNTLETNAEASRRE